MSTFLVSSMMLAATSFLPSQEMETMNAGSPQEADVCAVSYLAGSGYTLTVVLNFSTGEMVGFASG